MARSLFFGEFSQISSNFLESLSLLSKARSPIFWIKWPSFFVFFRAFLSKSSLRFVFSNTTVPCLSLYFLRGFNDLQCFLFRIGSLLSLNSLLDWRRFAALLLGVVDNRVLNGHNPVINLGLIILSNAIGSGASLSIN